MKSDAQEVNLKNCPNCGCRPVLKKKRNKFYYECGGCWTQTSKHWTQKEAADDWSKIESDELEM